MLFGSEEPPSGVELCRQNGGYVRHTNQRDDCALPGQLLSGLVDACCHAWLVQDCLHWPQAWECSWVALVAAQPSLIGCVSMLQVWYMWAILAATMCPAGQGLRRVEPPLDGAATLAAIVSLSTTHGPCPGPCMVGTNDRVHPGQALRPGAY